MNENKYKQSFYEFAVMILAVKNILESSSLIKRPDWIDLLLNVAFVGAILYKLSLQTYTLRRMYIFVGFGVLCAYTCLKADYFYVIFSFLCIIAMQGIDLKEVVAKTARIKTLLLLLHVGAYFLAMLLSPETISYTYRNGVRRAYFFLGHPNTFSMYVLWTSFEYIYSRYEKLSIQKLFGLWFINIATYVFTNSNTSIIVSTFVFSILILDKAGKMSRSSIIHSVSKYCFTACSVFFPLVIASFTKLSGGLLKVFYAFNAALTGRLMYGAYAYDTYGFSFIGRTLTFAKKTFWRGHWFDSIFFDNSYIWMFILYGYFYLIMISLAFIWISKKTTMLEKILIIAFSFYGIMEAYVINATICFPLLFIGKYLFLELKKKEERFNRYIAREAVQNR